MSIRSVLSRIENTTAAYECSFLFSFDYLPRSFFDYAAKKDCGLLREIRIFSFTILHSFALASLKKLVNVFEAFSGRTLD